MEKDFDLILHRVDDPSVFIRQFFFFSPTFQSAKENNVTDINRQTHTNITTQKVRIEIKKKYNKIKIKLQTI